MDWNAIYDRAESMTLDSDHIIALVNIAKRADTRNKQLLSTCPECGGSKEYNGRNWCFAHRSDCPWAVLERIEELQIEADDET